MAGRVDLLRGVLSILGVARAGSFRKAMRVGGTGFRKLNQDVQMVERTLGVLIFHRTTEGVVLTPEGKTIIEHASRIEETLGEIHRLGRAMGQQGEGEVMLAVTEGLGTFWVAPRLASFRQANPALSISLHPSMALADMRRFEIDLAMQVVPPEHPELMRIRLGTLHMVLSAAPNYLAQHGTPRTMEELAEHFFVFHSSPQSSDRHFIERALGQPLKRNRFMILRNSSAHYMTIEHGEGIGFLPTYGFAIGAKARPLNLPIQYALDIWLCFHERSRSIRRVSTAIDWLVANFDPRLYPWFRREYVHPSKFDSILEEQGSRSLVDRFAFTR
jgi:DNA-binding transcriptional LysR family regulator